MKPLFTCQKRSSSSSELLGMLMAGLLLHSRRNCNLQCPLFPGKRPALNALADICCSKSEDYKASHDCPSASYGLFGEQSC